VGFFSATFLLLLERLRVPATAKKSFTAGTVNKNNSKYF
jgi:hypothetical protein